MTPRARKRRPLETAPARPADAQAAAPADGVLRLQQTAGNRAVSALLQRQGTGRYHLLEGGLTLDPEIEAEMRRRGLFGPPAEKPFNPLDPKVIEKAVEGRERPDWTPLPEHVPREPEPIVPRGEGPKEPRKGGPGDVWDAVKKIPMVDRGLEKLKDEAKRRWRKLRGK